MSHMEPPVSRFLLDYDDLTDGRRAFWKPIHRQKIVLRGMPDNE